LNAEGLEDRQDLTDFGGGFASFEFYDEAQPSWRQKSVIFDR